MIHFPNRGDLLEISARLGGPVDSPLWTDRLQVDTLNEGFCLSIVGNQRVDIVNEFVKQHPAERTPMFDNRAEKTLVRVISISETLESVGNSMRLMRLSPVDIKELQTVADQLRTDAQ